MIKKNETTVRVSPNSYSVKKHFYKHDFCYLCVTRRRVNFWSKDPWKRWIHGSLREES